MPRCMASRDVPQATWQKWAKRAAIAGALIGVICRYLPTGYRAPCEVLAAICTGVL